MRLFAALSLPPDVRGWLGARQAPAAEAAPHLRWANPQQWHVTVAFFGVVAPARVDDLSTRLGRAAARTAPLDLCLSGPGRFGSARAARVLWQGVAGDVDRLRALAASCRAAGRRVGLRSDALAARRHYRPHVTLARCSPPGDVTQAAAMLAADDYPCWSASALLIVSSELGAGPAGRAHHEVISLLPFGSPPSSR